MEERVDQGGKLAQWEEMTRIPTLDRRTWLYGFVVADYIRPMLDYS